MSRTFIAACVAILMAAVPAAGALAADSHDHGGHSPASLSGLSLNNGQKWPTDGALRHGMDNIREQMAAALPKIHAGRLDDAGYAKLSGEISRQIEYVTANCRLPEDADGQLHLVLAQVIDGSDEMTKPRGGEAGAIKIVGALDAYGKYFAHPGWHAPGH
ncbi:MAG: hypothetical protein ACM33T_16480 [Solirubrobacterales bacterium]